MYEEEANERKLQQKEFLIRPRGFEDNRDNLKAIRFIGVLLIMFLFVVGFIYLTLPSQEFVDLGHQTMDMQKKNYCNNKCCSARLINIRNKDTGLYTTIDLIRVVANAGCVKCPDQNQFNSKDCNFLEQSTKK